MNFKKTLGLVLTAVVVSTSLATAKPVKAATTAGPTNFSYFFTKNSLVIAGETGNSYVVDTDYAGKVQYELWVKNLDDSNAQWQVISVNGSGKLGYTDAVASNNSPYAIPVKSDFSFSEGHYMVGVYAKAEGSTSTKSYGWRFDSNGKGIPGPKNTVGAETYDVVKTTPLNVLSTAAKAKYNEMLGDFLFSNNSSTTFIRNQTYTFTGFASQKSGAKYKLVVRKYGDPASKQQVLNNTFAQTVDWEPKEAGTYQLIAWSAPDVNKGAARDGWATETVTVTDKAAATVTSAESPALTAKQNDTTFAMPTTVKATLSDGSTVNAKVAWDAAPDVTKAGTTTITGKLTEYNNYAVKATVTVAAPAPALTYTQGSLGEVNPILGYVDFNVNDTSLIAKIIVDGNELSSTGYTFPNTTTVRLKNLSDDPTSVILVDKDGNKVTVKDSTPTPVDKTLTYTAGSLGEVNPILGYVDFNVNDTSLIAKIIVNGTELDSTGYSLPNATTVRLKNLSDDPTSVVLVDKAGNKVTVKDATPTPTPDPTPTPTPVSSLTYTANSLGTVNPILGYVDFKVNDTSLIAKVIVNGTELDSTGYNLPNATTVRLKNLSDDPTSIVLVDKAGIQVKVK